MIQNSHGTIFIFVLLHQNCFGHMSICKVHLLLTIHGPHIEVESQTKQILQDRHMIIVVETQNERHETQMVVMVIMCNQCISKYLIYF